MSMSKSTKTTSSNSQISIGTSPSANLVSTNDDLLAEILIRLPVRSLLQFESVSKRWLYLITSPRFRHRRSRTIAYASGLFLRCSSLLINPEHDFVPLDHHDQGQTKPPFKTLSFVNDPSGIRILQSCNGLLCCSIFVRGPTKKLNYYIYNPTTNQSTTLPHPSRRVFSAKMGVESVFSVTLAFDPSKSAHYKVVCVYFSDTLPEHYEMEIYSSETGLWRPYGDPFAAEVNFRHGIFWNGVINWFSTWGNTDSLYFDVEKEQLGVIPMPVYPDTVEQDRMMTQLMESRGHLHLIEILRHPSTELKIHEMEKDYLGWILKCRIDLQIYPMDAGGEAREAYVSVSISYEEPIQL